MPKVIHSHKTFILYIEQGKANENALCPWFNRKCLPKMLSLFTLKHYVKSVKRYSYLNIFPKMLPEEVKEIKIVRILDKANLFIQTPFKVIRYTI